MWQNTIRRTLSKSYAECFLLLSFLTFSALSTPADNNVECWRAFYVKNHSGSRASSSRILKSSFDTTQADATRSTASLKDGFERLLFKSSTNTGFIFRQFSAQLPREVCEALKSQPVKVYQKGEGHVFELADGDNFQIKQTLSFWSHMGRSDNDDSTPEVELPEVVKKYLQKEGEKLLTEGLISEADLSEIELSYNFEVPRRLPASRPSQQNEKQILQPGLKDQFTFEERPATPRKTIQVAPIGASRKH